MTDTKTTTATDTDTDTVEALSPEVRRTRRENAEHGFVASRALTDSLQAVLVDLIELANQGKQAHWNLVGPNFRDLHLQLDEVIDATREFADEVAERMRALHSTPDGRTQLVAQSTTLEQFPGGEVLTIDTADMVTARIEAVVATCRRVHDDVDEADPTSADLLHGIIQKLEQFAWMISAEHRRPANARG